MFGNWAVGWGAGENGSVVAQPASADGAASIRARAAGRR